MSVTPTDERDRLLHDASAAEALLLWGKRHDDAFAQTMALARLGPEDGLRWPEIMRLAQTLSDQDLNGLDAELAHWPDAMRVSEWWFWEEADPRLMTLVRTFRGQGDADDLWLSEIARKIRDSEDVHRVVSIDLRNCGLYSESALIYLESERLHSLRALSLEENFLKDDAALAIAASPCAKNLVSLSLAHNEITHMGVRALVRALTRLEHLNLAANYLGDGEGPLACQAIAEAHQLKTLVLRDNEFDDEDFRALAAAPNLSGLRALDLSEMPSYADEGLLEWVSSLRWNQLTALKLNDSIIGEQRASSLPVVETLIRSDFAPQLRHLEIKCQLYGSYHEFGDDIASVIASSPHARTLVHLSLSGLSSRGAQALADSPHLRNLKILDLERNAFSLSFGTHGAPLSILMNTPHLSAIKVLNLGFNHLQDTAVERLAESQSLSRIRMLRLNNNNLSSGAAVMLARSERLHNLASLDLRNNYIDDEGIVALANASHLHKLTSLDLRDNVIGERGAVALANAPHLSNLQHLKLDWNGMELESLEAIAESPYLNPTIRALAERGIDGDEVF